MLTFDGAELIVIRHQPESWNSLGQLHDVENVTVKSLQTRVRRYAFHLLQKPTCVFFFCLSNKTITVFVV